MINSVCMCLTQARFFINYNYFSVRTLNMNSKNTKIK
jgi:hypothetical protein